MLKFAGFALLVISGALFGLQCLGEKKRRLGFMRDMDTALAVMASEISLCARALPELFAGLSESAPHSVREFFAVAAIKCEECGACDGWREACEFAGTTEEGRMALCSLAPILGATTGERQCAELERVRLLLAMECERLGKAIDSRLKSWPAMGACLGGLAAIMLL